jgi:hypothetical protein
MQALKSLMYRRPFLLICGMSFLVFFTPLFWRMMKGTTTLIGEFPYHYLSGLIRLPFLVWWLLLILGSFAVVLLFYRLIRIHASNPLIRAVATMMFVITPTMVFLSFSVSPYLLALIILLAGLNLLHSHQSWAWVAFSLLLFFDWVTFLSSFIIVTTYLMFIEKEYLSRFVPGALLAFILVHLTFGRPFAFEPFYNRVPLVDFFSDFESIHGVGLFVFLLALIGFMLSWKDKKQFFPLYTAAFFLFVLFGVANVHVLLFLYPLLAVSAAVAFVYFWQRQWSFSAVRFLTLIVLLYGMLFSTLSYVNRVSGLGPQPAVFDSLDGVSGVVVSHPSNSFWIMYSGAEPYVTYVDADYSEKLNVTMALLRSRDLRRTQALVEAGNITYVWIDPAMKEGQVWDSKDDGLLFLLRKGHFARVYDEDGIELWRLG